MADQRHVFTILEDNSTAAGVKLPARSTGDASGGNHAPVITAIDASSQYQLIQLRDAGAASSGVDSLVGMIAIDSSDNLQYLELRQEGDAVASVDASPALVAKDGSGNFKYLLIDSEGRLVISPEADGVDYFDDAIVTPGAINSRTVVVTLTVAATKVYERFQAIAGSTFPCKWEVETIQDAAGTPTADVIGSFITGSGQFTFAWKPQHIEYTSGGTGDQEIVLYGTQLSGAASDMHGYLEVFEQA